MGRITRIDGIHRDVGDEMCDPMSSTAASRTLVAPLMRDGPTTPRRGVMHFGRTFVRAAQGGNVVFAEADAYPSAPRTCPSMAGAPGLRTHGTRGCEPASGLA